jgi:spermidine synthase
MSSRRILILLYGMSGAAALVYEVAWTRLLSLELGHTVAAASTVLAAFMGGLALGAAVGAPVAARGKAAPQSALRWYAALELVVAVAALLLPAALHASEPWLAWAYADGTAPARFAIVRIVVSLMLIGVPAAAMGATFPIAVAYYAQNASDAGALYAANTFGAATGAIAAGFLLLPIFGLRGSTFLGVALNGAAAAGAWRIASRAAVAADGHATAEPTSAVRTRRAPKRNAPNHAPPPAARTNAHSIAVLAASVAAVTGFSALAYEVAWTRLLALVLGPTTYAFATMAAAFITGIALGSAAGARISRRTLRPIAWLGGTVIACALASTTASWFAATRLPFVVAAEVAAPDAAFGAVVGAQALRVGLLLLPMTIALGAAFPLAIAAASGTGAEIERAAARVYSWNTAGAIAGALTAGFVLIPMVGLRATLDAAALGAVLAGARCMAASGRWMLGMPAAALAFAGVFLFPSWDRDVLASGAYKYAPYLETSVFESVLRAGTLEYYKEGAAGTVTVRRLAGTLSLAIDGKIDASNGGDMLTQRLLGLLPVLLHGKATDVCVIGLGSGVTSGAVLAPGTVRRADVVEISPEVVEASHLFDRENGSVLSRPEVRLIVGDGRSHLKFTPRRYDVIVSEPSNPWMAGVAALFTREFFEAARSRLKPGGLLCQWAHTYDISNADLRSIVRTFESVFPQGTMWMVGEGDLLLIGGADDAAPPALDGLAERWRLGTVPAALEDVGVGGSGTPFALLSLFAGGPREVRQFAADAQVQTDDRVALEFSAPRGIYGRAANENGAAIRRLLTDPPAAVKDALANATDADWTTRGRMELKAEAYTFAYDAFRQAVALNPRNADALSGLSQAAAVARRTDDELRWLAALAAADPRNAAVRIEQSHLLAATGDFDAAAKAAAAALDAAPESPEAGEQLASVLADAGDVARLTDMADALVRRFPERPTSLYYRASAWFMAGRAAEAAEAARQIVAAHPGDAKALNLLGAACATLGDHTCARSALEASIRANPRDSSAYVNLGTFLMQSGDAAGAEARFAEALSVDPTSAAARSGLSQARTALEKP